VTLVEGGIGHMRTPSAWPSVEHHRTGRRSIQSWSPTRFGRLSTVDQLVELAHRLTAIGGVIGVCLGGSRARGTHRPDSDFDLGLYYRPPLDTAALRLLAAEVTGDAIEVTEPGGWGPWVDGGGWLIVAESWMLNEKGAVGEAGRLPGAPADFAARAHALFGALDATPDKLTAALDDAHRLAAEVLDSLTLESE
jgi:predicted nucleotidyltransferase